MERLIALGCATNNCNTMDEVELSEELLGPEIDAILSSFSPEELKTLNAAPLDKVCNPLIFTQLHITLIHISSHLPLLSLDKKP